jgi:hypothetical protein
VTGRIVAGAYVATVAITATIGFTTDSTAAILLAVLLTLPSGVPAVVGYYLVYGLLAQVPGANPDSVSGYESCTADGECHGSTTGELVTWFAVTTDLIGIVALTAAALLDVVLVRLLLRLRGSASASGRTPSAA